MTCTWGMFLRLPWLYMTWAWPGDDLDMVWTRAWEQSMWMMVCGQICIFWRKCKVFMTERQRDIQCKTNQMTQSEQILNSRQGHGWVIWFVLFCMNQRTVLIFLELILYLKTSFFPKHFARIAKSAHLCHINRKGDGGISKKIKNVVT